MSSAQDPRSAEDLRANRGRPEAASELDQVCLFPVHFVVARYWPDQALWGADTAEEEGLCFASELFTMVGR